MKKDNESPRAAWLYPALDLAATVTDVPLRYWKDVVAVGSYVHPTQKRGDGSPVDFELNADDLKTLVASFAEMSAAGDEPPVIKDHKETSDNTLGYIKGVRINGDRLQMLHEFTDDQSRDIALRNKVSAKLHPNYRMSNGKVLPLAISHVATTPKPVITQQDDWAIAAARGSERDDAPVLFLAVSIPAKEDQMKLTPEQMQRIKALAPASTEETALDLLLSAAEADHISVASLTAENTRLKKLPGTIELSAARKMELVENLDTYIELTAVKNQWPDACTSAVKKEFASDELLLSRNEAGDVLGRKLVEAIAPFIAKGILANAKEKTAIQLSREIPGNGEDRNKATGTNPYEETINRLAPSAT